MDPSIPTAFSPTGDPIRASSRFDAGRGLVYAVGDIHGRYDLLKLLLGRILEDFNESGVIERPVLVFCGDYIDRGPQSAEVVEAILWLRDNADIEVRALKGNHEKALLDFMENPLDAAAWLDFGGTETLRSYGVEPPSPEAGDEDYFRAARDLLGRMPASHVRLLEDLELIYRQGDCVFAHAGIRPGVGLADQAEDDLLWIREEFLDWEGPSEHLIVHGHSWFGPKPQVLGHRLGIDTGAYATGVLTAARLQGSEITFLYARGEVGKAAAETVWRGR